MQERESFLTQDEIECGKGSICLLSWQIKCFLNSNFTLGLQEREGGRVEEKQREGESEGRSE